MIFGDFLHKQLNILHITVLSVYCVAVHRHIVEYEDQGIVTGVQESERRFIL